MSSNLRHAELWDEVAGHPLPLEAGLINHCASERASPACAQIETSRTQDPKQPTIFCSVCSNGDTVGAEPDSENSLFSEPMKMCTPSVHQAEGLNEIRLGVEILERQAHPLTIALPSSRAR